MSAATYECTRCGAAFGIAGPVETDEDREADEDFNELVRWHEDKLCAPLARTSLERAQLLVDLQWDDEDSDVPDDAVATAYLALAEEQRTANLIALLAIPTVSKNTAVKNATKDISTQILARLGLAGDQS